MVFYRLQVIIQINGDLVHRNKNAPIGFNESMHINTYFRSTPSKVPFSEAMGFIVLVAIAEVYYSVM